MSYTCNYGTGWLPNNFIVILLSIAIISFVYLASRFLPGGTRTKVTGLIRSELTQVFISMIIILALLGTTNFICQVAASATSYLGSPVPVPQTVGNCGILSGSSVCLPFPALPEANVAITAATQPGDPFAYALAYTGNYAFDTGPKLGIEVYAYSYSYAILSAIWAQVGAAIGTLWSGLSKGIQAGPVQVTIGLPVGTDLSAPYSILSSVLLDVFTPMVMIGVGAMLFQYIILVVSQASMFVIVLPIAIAMRSLSFTGANLRYAANSVLAIAIALYIVYPVMIVYDSYFIHWLFTPCPTGTVNTGACNPEAEYLLITYSHDNLNNLMSSSAGCSAGSFLNNINVFGVNLPIEPCGSGFLGFLFQLGSSVSSLPGLFGIANAGGDQIVQGVQYLALSISEFMLIVIVLFAVNVMVTLGFAMGLARALESGVEGAASFWSNL